MRRTLVLLAVPVVTLLALSGCAFGVRGPMTTETRQIDPVEAVVLDTPGELDITVGDPVLVVHAPADVLDDLSTEVVGGQLRLELKRSGPGFLLGEIRYELSLPSLERIQVNGSGDVESDVPADDLEVEVNGSGDVDVASIDASAVTVAVSGSGDVELAGRATELTVDVEGSADIDAEELDAERVTVEIDGSGDIAVSASETLDASISGSGSVRYVGRPRVSQDISGSGDVAPLD